MYIKHYNLIPIIILLSTKQWNLNSYFIHTLFFLFSTELQLFSSNSLIAIKRPIIVFFFFQSLIIYVITVCVFNFLSRMVAAQLWIEGSLHYDLVCPSIYRWLDIDYMSPFSFFFFFLFFFYFLRWWIRRLVFLTPHSW